jgi:RHH-type transcriptional regulator, rel operon repressor / antitoxin RelB
MAERLAGRAAKRERRVFPPEELGAGSFLLYMYSRSFQMLALRLAPEIEKRLEALARKTGRTKSFYAREAILRHLDDIEDAHLARERLGRRRGRVSLEALEKELGAGPAK